jgi:hypothetical protein
MAELWHFISAGEEGKNLFQKGYQDSPTRSSDQSSMKINVVMAGNISLRQGRRKVHVVTDELRNM